MNVTKQCVECERKFQTYKQNAKTCSKVCGNAHYRKQTGRVSSGLSNGVVGAMSEMQVSIDLMKKGYSVFRALSPACFCDLVVVKDGLVLNVEVRTGYRNPNTGNLAYPKIKNGNEKIHYFAVFVPQTNSIHFFNEEFESVELS